MTSRGLRRVLLGQEAAGSHGVGVDPDIALRAIGSLKAVADKRVVNEDIGCLAPARSYLGSIRAEGSLDMEAATYQQIPYMIAMALGDVEATGSDVECIWNWPWPCGTAPTFATYTMEYTDGGSWIVRATDVFATGLTITGEAGAAWQVVADIVGGEVTYPTTLTDPLVPLDPTMNEILMGHTSLWADTAYDDIGTTPVTDAHISFNWKLENLQHQKLFGGSMYPTGRGNDKWAISLEIVIETENAVALSERANHITDLTQSAIRIQSSLVVFPGVTWIARIDGNYMLDDVSSLDERDGNNIVTLTYRGEMSPDSDTGAIYIVNDLCDLAEGGYFYEPPA